MIAIGGLVGRLSYNVNDLQSWTSIARNTAMGIIELCCELGDHINTRLDHLILNKMKINSLKYPPGKEKYVGKNEIQKWYERSDNGGLSKADDFSVHMLSHLTNLPDQTTNRTIMNQNTKYLKEEVKQFVEDRGLANTYTPTSLTLSLMSEAGELAETVQWVTSQSLLEDFLHSNEGKKRARMSEEIADVVIYCLHIFRFLEYNFKSCEEVDD